MPATPFMAGRGGGWIGVFGAPFVFDVVHRGCAGLDLGRAGQIKGAVRSQ